MVGSLVRVSVVAAGLASAGTAMADNGDFRFAGPRGPGLEGAAAPLQVRVAPLIAGLFFTPAWAGDVLPPTMSRVVFQPGGAVEIDGRGEPGSTVRLTSGEATLAETTVGANGNWRIVLNKGLTPGEHRLQTRAVRPGDAHAVFGDDARIAVPAEFVSDAVVAFESAAPQRAAERDDRVRERAEQLARDAGEAYTDIMAETARPSAEPPPRPGVAEVPDGPATGPDAQTPGGSAADEPSTLDSIVDWLRRSARAYDDKIVKELSVPVPGLASSPPDPSSPAELSAKSDAREVARRLAEDRRRAEQDEQRRRAEPEARKAAEAKRLAEVAARKEAEARKAAEDLARRQREADQRIADNLEKLKIARAEADRKAAQSAGRTDEEQPPAPAITLESFTLPGDETPQQQRLRLAREAADDPNEEGSAEPPIVQWVGRTPRPEYAMAGTSHRAASRRCSKGRVVRRSGKRWYVVGSTDTLWSIARRYYGSGLAWPKIYRANRTRLSDPDIVRPCQRLRLPR